ncbi:hypothetical protein PG997_004650 [Apiospora hydei]|uniref:Uncharacterized protein n=1 Tax=Apiospora hydei TaxID=1337664 RepID=A0ABR1X2X9_9PEZI
MRRPSGGDDGGPQRDFQVQFIALSTHELPRPRGLALLVNIGLPGWAAKAGKSEWMTSGSQEAP